MLNHFKDMKLPFSVVLFVYVTLIVADTEKPVTQCYKCEHASNCHSPIANVSILDKETCGAEIVHEHHNTTDAAHGGSTVAPTTAAAPARLVERQEADLKAFKCIVITGKDNVTKGKMTFRGCSAGGCKGHTMTSIVEAVCEDCAADLCNLSVRINPFGWVVRLITMITMICLGLEWSKLPI